MDDSPPRPARSLSSDVVARFSFPRTRQRFVRSGIGRLSAATTRFAGEVGISVGSRRRNGSGVGALAGLRRHAAFDRVAPGSTADAPVGLIPLPLLAALRAASAVAPEPAPGAFGAPAGSVARRPEARRGLPRATARNRNSAAGADTAPGSGGVRMALQSVAVRTPTEVRAAGPMLTPGEGARAMVRPSGPTRAGVTATGATGPSATAAVIWPATAIARTPAAGTARPSPVDRLTTRGSPSWSQGSPARPPTTAVGTRDGAAVTTLVRSAEPRAALGQVERSGSTSARQVRATATPSLLGHPSTGRHGGLLAALPRVGSMARRPVHSDGITWPGHGPDKAAIRPGASTAPAGPAWPGPLLLRAVGSRTMTGSDRHSARFTPISAQAAMPATRQRGAEGARVASEATTERAPSRFAVTPAAHLSWTSPGPLHHAVRRWVAPTGIARPELSASITATPKYPSTAQTAAAITRIRANHQPALPSAFRAEPAPHRAPTTPAPRWADTQAGLPSAFQAPGATPYHAIRRWLEPAHVPGRPGSRRNPITQPQIVAPAVAGIRANHQPALPSAFRAEPAAPHRAPTTPAPERPMRSRVTPTGLAPPRLPASFAATPNYPSTAQTAAAITRIRANHQPALASAFQAPDVTPHHAIRRWLEPAQVPGRPGSRRNPIAQPQVLATAVTSIRGNPRASMPSAFQAPALQQAAISTGTARTNAPYQAMPRQAAQPGVAQLHLTATPNSPSAAVAAAAITRIRANHQPALASAFQAPDVTPHHAIRRWLEPAQVPGRPGSRRNPIAQPQVLATAVTSIRGNPRASMPSAFQAPALQQAAISTGTARTNAPYQAMPRQAAQPGVAQLHLTATPNSPSAAVAAAAITRIRANHQPTLASAFQAPSVTRRTPNPDATMRQSALTPGTLRSSIRPASQPATWAPPVALHAVRRSLGATGAPGHPGSRPASIAQPRHPAGFAATANFPSTAIAAAAVARIRANPQSVLPSAFRAGPAVSRSAPSARHRAHSSRHVSLVDNPTSLRLASRPGGPAARATIDAFVPPRLDTALRSSGSTGAARAWAVGPIDPLLQTASSRRSPAARGLGAQATVTFGDRKAAGPNPPIPSSPASRFSRVLRMGAPEPIRPLPGRFLPLAAAITGGRPPSVRTGPVTRRALQAAGKRAATVGRVIHLPAPPDSSERTAAVIAHELVHVAVPSPLPRFYADDRHNAEEAVARRAEGLARAVKPVADAGPGPHGQPRLTWGTAGLSVGAAGGLLAGGSGRRPEPPKGTEGLVQRSRASTRSAKQSLVERTAGLFAAQDRRRSESAATDTRPAPDIIRAIVDSGVSVWPTGGTPDPNHPRPGDPPIVRRRLDTSVEGSSALDAMGPQVEQSSAALTNEQLDTIVDALEQRVLAELERRGRRLDPGVF